jgi:hypothetical protein
MTLTRDERWLAEHLEQLAEHAGPVPAPDQMTRRVANSHHPTAPPDSRSARRLALAVAVVLVAALVGAALVRTVRPGEVATSAGPDPSRASVAPTPTVTDELGEGIFRAQADHVDQWLAEYDQAEVEHVRASARPNGGVVTKANLVDILEFRRACRALASAVPTARQASDADRAVAVDRIMTPALQRLRDRQLFPQSQTPDMFTTLTQQLKAGDIAAVEQTLLHNCTDALGPWHDNG